MQRIDFISHQGRRVLLVDLVGLRDEDELRRVLEATSLAIRAEPPGSGLVLVQLGGGRQSLRAVRLLGEAAASNALHVRARAVVGVHQDALATLRAVAVFSGRPVEAFDTRAAALDWLVHQT